MTPSPRPLLALAALTWLSLAAAAPAPEHLIAYDDLGAPGRQPHLVQGTPWVFEEARVTGSAQSRSVAFDARTVSLRYSDLAPGARYLLRAELCTERDNPRAVAIYANGQLLLDKVQVPAGEPAIIGAPLPASIAAAGAIQIEFRLLSGHNAVASQVWLLSDVAQSFLHASLVTAAEGVAVAVVDGLAEPVPGASVALQVPSLPEPLLTLTGADGRVTFPLEEALAPSVTGVLHARVTHGEASCSTEADLDELIVRPPVLWPVPDWVSGLPRPAVSLDGPWRFSPSAASEAPGWRDRLGSQQWATIQVPGEWTMQGFTVPPGQPAAYWRTFPVPGNWRGLAVRLRFDAVFSDCTVWLNGELVGRHQGGFTPFELDLTTHVRPGKTNTLALEVTSESLSDALASASSYARHPLGGITRKVTLYAVPRTHLTRLHFQTDLDRDYRDARLYVSGNLEGPLGNVHLRFTLRDPRGALVRFRDTPVRPLDDGAFGLTGDIPAPRLWSDEDPALYTLTTELRAGNATLERLVRPVGFREVEVRGTRLLVNGRPVKLRGTCRHELDLTRGRSLQPDRWAREVELLKGANINYVRTSHYPPAEEFIALCDRAGIYVQDEAPFCWVGGGLASSPEALGPILRQTAAMVERDRDHPSVIIWDLANESAWGSNFLQSHRMVREADPTRPTLFSGASDADPAAGAPQGVCEIASWHYPGPGFTPGSANWTRPITFDEYCHLNCYNAAEVSLDPGLREYWGRALKGMWDEMAACDPCLGGALWCWSDDLFEIPGAGRVGYGEWGVVDALARPKPEWWHVRKVYSPLRVVETSLPPTSLGQSLSITLQNRYTFTDLARVTVRWSLGARKGRLEAPAAPPGHSATLSLPGPARVGERLSLEFTDPHGRVVDEYSLPVVAPSQPAPEPPLMSEPPTYETSDAEVRVTCPDFWVALNRATGELQAGRGRDLIILGGPAVVASEQGAATDLWPDEVTPPTNVDGGINKTGGAVILWDRATAAGTAHFAATISRAGGLSLDWSLDYTGAGKPVREIGVRWILAPEFQNLSWERRAPWTVYPPRHIGAAAGSEVAFPVLPGAPRPALWEDETDARGSNAFRAGRHDIVWADLTSPRGSGVRVIGGPGGDHLRACAIATAARKSWQVEGFELRVNAFANGGGESFLAAQYAAGVRAIQPGETLEGTCRLQLLKEGKGR